MSLRYKKFMHEAQDESNVKSKGVRGSLAAGLAGSLQKRFEDVINLEDKYACIATVLDPHYKYKMSCFGSRRQDVKRMLLSQAPQVQHDQ